MAKNRTLRFLCQLLLLLPFLSSKSTFNVDGRNIDKYRSNFRVLNQHPLKQMVHRKDLKENMRNVLSVSTAHLPHIFRGGGDGITGNSDSSLSHTSLLHKFRDLFLQKPYVSLILSISFDMIGTAFMKKSKGLTEFDYAMGAFTLYMLAYTFFGLVLEQLPLSTVYAYFQAGGTLLSVAMGVALFNETLSLNKAICLMMIVVGVVGLEMS